MRSWSPPRKYVNPFLETLQKRASALLQSLERPLDGLWLLQREVGNARWVSFDVVSESSHPPGNYSVVRSPGNNKVPAVFITTQPLC